MGVEPSSTAADLLAGFISGSISTLAVHPIDTVLTRFQAQGEAVVSKTTAKGSTHVHCATALSNHSVRSASSQKVSTNATAGQQVRHAVTSATGFPASAAIAESRAMASSMGILSLWRGAPALIGAAPFQNALLMAGYGAGRRWSSGSDEEGGENGQLPRYGDIFIGGVVGGLAQCIVASPAELFKVQRQVRDITKQHSQASPRITAGLGATMLRDGLPHGVWFASYEWCKYRMSNKCDVGDASNSSNSLSESYEQVLVPLTSGAFAATIAWVVGYPFDLIKTRIQAGRASGVLMATTDLITVEHPVTKQKVYLDANSAVRKLWSGLELKLARAVPASAIGFLAYEYALAAIEGQISAC